MAWIDYGSSGVQAQSPGGSLGAKPPNSEDQHVKRSTDNHAVVNFSILCIENALKRNPINIHQIYRPKIDLVLSRLDEAWSQ